MFTTIKKHFTTLFLRDLRDKAGGTIFSVEFYKKDGSYRKMKARFGVAKDLKGKGLAYDPLDKGLINVWDMDKQAYRMITVDRIEQLKVKGKTYKFGA
jgi:hypothetical protein